MSNRNVITKAFASFRDQIASEVRHQLNVVGQNLLSKAITARLNAKEGHDYTGNLVNSIVVVLYDEGEIVSVFSPGDTFSLRPPISGKMTARKRPYFFRKDWSGSVFTKYVADVDTDRGFAAQDIENFLHTNRPSYTQGYCLTVAYTVEYADWVESMRQTTGFLESQRYAGKSLRMLFVPLKAS